MAGYLTNWPHVLKTSCAQPYDLPERLLAANPDDFLDWTLRKMIKAPAALSDKAVQSYRDAFRRPDVRHAMMQDYRTAATVDHKHDLDDRTAGRQLDCPVLVLWRKDALKERPLALHIWRGPSERRATPFRVAICNRHAPSGQATGV